MNRSHVFESSPVQQLVAAGNPNWWSVNGCMNPPPPLPLPQSQMPPFSPHSFLRRPHILPPLPSFLPQFMMASPTSSSSSYSSSPSLPNHNNLNYSIASWLDHNDLPPESWSLSQLLLGGLMMGEEERLEMKHEHHQSFHGKKLENWEEQLISQEASMATHETMKQEKNNNNGYVLSPTSPFNNNSMSCITTNTTSSLNSNGCNSLLDFSSNPNGSCRHLAQDSSSECRNSEIKGSATKKPRLQPSSPSTQTTLKVRKEKLGGRIAALHQLVSPFGKTDTASVLSESIGYIRFLHSQIEALSLPYLGNMRPQQHVQSNRHCIFPEDPGQLVNEHCIKGRGASSSSSLSSSSSSSSDNQIPNNEEPKKDLRSRGLCLVPIACTLQVGNDNGADYWTPAALGVGFR